MTKRFTEKWTLVRISFTDIEGKRVKEVLVRFHDVEWYDTRHAYNAIKKYFPKYKKVYVHEVVETYYYED